MLSSLLIQNLIVGAIVLVATVLLLIRASKYLRPAKSNAGCASGCGGCASQTKMQTNLPANLSSQPKLLQLGQTSRRE
ncbi:FeoB-associated Cys-rich membrane protein [Anatilimnocola floriformis]|uniref:FeoB-associated Cys-rich membrane protein n=1 Tax=Anatilimnocola floriformis TaxID=2948575 RepID=UPI0020C1E328|nr:FeoB-associated Cys-rich membrane protein [Anatilimnocola floriformis]